MKVKLKDKKSLVTAKRYGMKGTESRSGLEMAMNSSCWYKMKSKDLWELIILAINREEAREKANILWRKMKRDFVMNRMNSKPKTC